MCEHFDLKKYTVLYDGHGNRIYDINSAFVVVIPINEAAEYITKHSLLEGWNIRKTGIYGRVYDSEKGVRWVNLLGTIKEYANILRSCGFNVEIKLGQANWEIPL